MNNYRAYTIAAFICAAIILSIIAGISLFYPFAAGILFSVLILSRDGLAVRNLAGMAWAGIWDCRALFLFILLIGANISVWMASGIVPSLMYYGFQYLNAPNFLVVVFLITGVISLFMGTAVGTIGTLGIALLGIGRGFGTPQGILLGALVSGAFLADKISPISALLNLTLKATGTSYTKVVKSMLRTLVPVMLAAGVGYFLLGNTLSPGENGALIQLYREALTAEFNLSPWLLLMPLAVIVLPLTGIKALPTVLAGAGTGTILALAYQKVGFSTIFSHIMWGYRSIGVSAELNSILYSGGVWGMAEVVLIVAAIIALSSILEKTELLKPLVYTPIARAATKGGLVLKTGLIGIVLTILTCDQTAGIVLQGRLYRERYEGMGVDRAILARTISDTGTIVAPLIPWNINAIIIGLATGVSALEYAPYALLCYLFPLSVVWIYFVRGRIFPEGAKVTGI